MIQVLLSQLAWASAARVHVDRAGYTDSLEANLWRPLSPRTELEFRKCSGTELDQKMRSLHSSAALAANLFDYWSEQDPRPLARALGLKKAIRAIDFETLRGGPMPGSPSNLDVSLTLADDSVIGVQTRFGEWLVPKVGQGAVLAERALGRMTGSWQDHHLGACQSLVEAMRSGKRSFRYLDAAQLLRHALVLARRHGADASLWYLYYEWDVPQSSQHAREVEAFAALVGGELRFRALTCQELFAGLKKIRGREHREYLDYLEKRYFAARPAVAGVPSRH